MPQAQQLTPEKREKLNRALILERAGKLTPDQQDALNEIRQSMSEGADLAQRPTAPRLNPRTGLPMQDINIGGAIRENLPAIGAGAAVALAPTGIGILPALGIAAAGGAAGEATKQLSEFGTEDAPKTSGEAFKRMAGEGALQGAIEGAFRGGGKLIKWGASKFGQTIPVRRAVNYLSQEIRKFGGESPAKFGAFIQKTYDDFLHIAGADKGAVVATLPKSVPFKSKNTLTVLDEEISGLKKSIAEGRLSTEMGGGAGKLMEILQKRRAALEQDIALGNVRELDKARTDFFKATMEADPSEARRISRRLSRAVHEDIVGALEGSGLSAERKAYESTSARFREVSEMAEDIPALVKVFGDKRVAPEQVVKQLQQVPEASVEMIKVLSKKDPSAVTRVRRALLEDMVAANKLPAIRDDVLHATFGGQAPKVIKFAELMRTAGPKNAMLSSGGVGIPGTPARVYIHTPSGTEIHISARKLAEILDTPNGLVVAEKLRKTPITAPNAANLFRTFLFISDLFGKKEEVRQGSGIATLEEIARAKGIEIRRR